jgi:hypothetical protein
MAYAKDRVAMIEILKRDRSLADADRLRQADAGRLVAHVRAIRKIVGSVFSRKQLIEESRLVGGPTGGVKLRHVGVRQRTERGADLRQCLVPRNRQVPIGRLVVDHRVRQTALILQVEIRPLPEFAYRMRRKKLRRRPFGRRFP